MKGTVSSVRIATDDREEACSQRLLQLLHALSMFKHAFVLRIPMSGRTKAARPLTQQ